MHAQEGALAIQMTSRGAPSSGSLSVPTRITTRCARSPDALCLRSGGVHWHECGLAAAYGRRDGTCRAYADRNFMPPPRKPQLPLPMLAASNLQRAMVR
jgi:hypothetical protein